MSGAEILGVAAGVLQIAELGGKLSVRLFTFTRKVKNADKQIDSISQDIAATGAVLQQLGNELNKDEHLRLCSPEAVAEARKLMEACRGVFDELNDAIDGKGKAKGAGKWLALKRGINYTFVEEQIQLLKAKLEHLKSSLLVMLNVLIFAGQLKSNEALPVLQDQRELLKQLVEEKLQSQRQFDLLLKRLDHVSLTTNDDCSASIIGKEALGTSNSSITLVSSNNNNSTASVLPQEDKHTLAPYLPMHLRDRAEEIFDHCRLVRALIDEVNHVQYKLDLGIKYRAQQKILENHHDEWSKHWTEHEVHEPVHARFKCFESIPTIRQYWTEQATRGQVASQPTQYYHHWQPQANDAYMQQQYQMQLMLLEQQQKKRLMVEKESRGEVVHPLPYTQDGNPAGQESIMQTQRAWLQRKKEAQLALPDQPRDQAQTARWSPPPSKRKASIVEGANPSRTQRPNPSRKKVRTSANTSKSTTSEPPVVPAPSMLAAPPQQLTRQPETAPGLDGSSNNQNLNLDFSTLENADVLENFDFDNFLGDCNDHDLHLDLGDDSAKPESPLAAKPTSPHHSTCTMPDCGKTFHRLDLLQRHQERHKIEQLSQPQSAGGMPGSPVAQGSQRTSSSGLSIGSLLNPQTGYSDNMSTPLPSGFERSSVRYFSPSDDHASRYITDSRMPESEHYGGHPYRQSISHSSSVAGSDEHQANTLAGSQMQSTWGPAVPTTLAENMFGDRSTPSAASTRLASIEGGQEAARYSPAESPRPGLARYSPAQSPRPGAQYWSQQHDVIPPNYSGSFSSTPMTNQQLQQTMTRQQMLMSRAQQEGDPQMSSGNLPMTQQQEQMVRKHMMARYQQQQAGTSIGVPDGMYNSNAARIEPVMMHMSMQQQHQPQVQANQNVSQNTASQAQQHHQQLLQAQAQQLAVLQAQSAAGHNRSQQMQMSRSQMRPTTSEKHKQINDHLSDSAMHLAKSAATTASVLDSFANSTKEMREFIDYADEVILAYTTLYTCLSARDVQGAMDKAEIGSADTRVEGD